MKSYISLLRLCILSSLWTSVSAATLSPVVQTTYGKVQGILINQTFDGVDSVMERFRGIPYARPPIGSLRFKKPEPPSPWNGIKNVGNDRSQCVQTLVNPVAEESEDCLYLDVYRPHGVNSSNQLPVLVWIHGGGYTYGSKAKAEWVSGGIFPSKGFIVVRINYRLGPFGFLSTEDDVIPGNYGMLDQISALKWVQLTIAAFGGNPKKVTVFGESAGSASVSLLVLSPLAKGLFTRAIMESGVATSSRDVTPPKAAVTPKDMALAAGQALGCGQTPGQTFLTCLQSKNTTDVLRECLQAAKLGRSSGGHYRPRVETVFGFMPDYPLNLISRGEFNNVDTIRGFMAQELGKSIHDNNNNGLTIADFRKLCMKQLRDFPYLDTNNFLQRMIEVYIGNVTDPLIIRSRAIDMISDFTFISPIVLEAMVTKKTNPSHRSYLFKFNQKPSHSTSPDWQGVNHGDEISFVFGGVGNRGTPAEVKISHKMVEMWTNFAKNGNPTPGRSTQPPIIHWDQCWNFRPSYLLIEENFQMLTYDTPYDVARLNLYRVTQAEYMKATATGTSIVG